MTDSRPCPVCHGDGCKCCDGSGSIPYPWVLPEDGPIQQQWTLDEVAVVIDAPNPSEAYARYCYIYGEHNRTYSSVRHKWKNRTGVHDCWTTDELEAIEDADTVWDAVAQYRAVCGTARTDRAVCRMWWKRRRTRHAD